MLLSYWLAARRSYLWIVTAVSVRIVALPPAREIDRLVREHQRTIESTPGDPTALRGGAGDRLYQLLIAPAEAPDGPWNTAPRPPPGPTRTVSPFARMSPFGRLIVDVAPSAVPDGPTISQPLVDGSTTVAPLQPSAL